jgi:hypothetical protein
MYPRNNASPPVIDLGEIVLKSDGTQQTTGASARVKIGIGAWGAAAGTLDCDATSGIWTYAPTQAETNAEFFIVAAYKANCTSVSKTIVTTNAATAGQVRLDGVTHTGAVVPTVSAVTGLTVGNLDVAVSSRMATYTQPTGFLAATFPTTVASPTNITAGTITTVTNLTNLPSIPNNWITAAGIANDAITDAKVASDVTIASVTGSVGSVAGNVSGSVASVVGNVGGNVTGSVASVVGAVGSVTGLNVAHIDAAVSSRATQVSVDTKPSLPAIEASTILAREATVNAVGVVATARPTLAQIEASTVLAKEATVAERATQTSVDGKPTLAQIEASTVLPTKTDVQNAGLL